MLAALALRRSLAPIESMPLLRQIGMALYERRFASASRANLFRGVYRDFADARAHTPNTKPAGYDHPAAAAMYRDRMQTLAASDYPALHWVGQLAAKVDSLFDFGGHVGVLYYAFSARAALPKTLRWTVYDVPEVAAAGRQLAASHAKPALHFTSTLADASGCDLFLASGSLQYVEQPLAQMLERLDRLPKRLLINLTPLHAQHQFVTLQNIGTAFCPYLIQQRDAFIGSLHALGYDVVDHWHNPDKRCMIPFYPRHSIDGYDGLLLRLAR